MIDQSYRDSIERSIVEIVISSLEQGVLPESELPLIADFILESLDAITTQTQLVSFLENLTRRWNIFSQLELSEKGKYIQAADKEVADGVLLLAKSGKIDEALRLAKGITQNN